MLDIDHDPISQFSLDTLLTLSISRSGGQVSSSGKVKYRLGATAVRRP